MSQPPTLSTTTYVILGHLALRDWSTYELAHQMKRSTGHYWPRAQSKIYEEPKKLVAHGLATATREYTGRRRRTVYRITSKGRRALKRWLAEPGHAPVVEFEGLVKVLFAEQGTKSVSRHRVRRARVGGAHHSAGPGPGIRAARGTRRSAFCFRFRAEPPEGLGAPRAA